MASFTRKDYEDLVDHATRLHALAVRGQSEHRSTPANRAWREVNRAAADIMTKVELVIGQQSGSRWWEIFE